MSFSDWPKRLTQLVLALACCFLIASVSSAPNDGYVLYLDEYLTGDYYVAELRDIDSDNPPLVNPRKLQLPASFRQSVEIGNADVSVDGSTIVFAARQFSDLDWDIYKGTIDLQRNGIRNVSLLVRNEGGRDEDPKFSWDGMSVIYKCDGDICIYPELYPNPVVSSWCELWSPAYSPTGYTISYTKRCADSDSDRIWEYGLMTGIESIVPNDGGGPDRFAQYLDDGRLVYSHVNTDTATSDLWQHNLGFTSMLYDGDASDDDPYPDKHNRDRIAFIGWDDVEANYNLYIYRRGRADAVQLTEGTPVLAPVLFRP